MALTINTNMASLNAQHALAGATKSMNTAIEKLTTGYKINSAKDDAAGLAVATKMQVKLSSVAVAEQNVQLGNSLMDTIEGNYEVIQSHLQRIRDLTEQAANGTYASDSRVAIQTEITQRFQEISRVANSTEYNGMYLICEDDTAAGRINNFKTGGLTLQVGITAGDESIITMNESLFKACSASGLLNKANATALGNFAKECAGFDSTSDEMDVSKARAALTTIDAAIQNITDRTTVLGSVQNRLESASDALQVQSDNLTSSLSTVRDADVAKVSSEYISAQILQQASASLLTTANQTPQIALNLV